MSDLKAEFLKLKREIVLDEFKQMNSMQQKAIFKTVGPVLILAGAGSGKTTVMVNRIAYMLRYGNTVESGYVPDDISQDDIDLLKSYRDGDESAADRVHELLRDEKIMPWNILAITFTNKAANELKDRLYNMLGESALDINTGTFHSTCVRILRREIQCLGYDSRFTIYDTTDSVRVIKDCLKELDFSEKEFPPKSILNQISISKDRMVMPEEYEQSAGNDFRKQIIAKVYSRYQKKLASANAVDFDDIIMLTVRLFDEFPDILEKYRARFKYIMVDEYQDTNNIQYRLVSMLSARHRNICVVGDDDQSIYRFRGATIENILMFEKQYDNACVVRLEQNYRSTQNILTAANEVIKNNFERKGKKLWTAKGDGEKIIVCKTSDERAEAEYITEQILQNVKNGMKFSDHAVLYRINAASNNIERNFARSGISYKIVGGTKFYERKEIKDVLSYMCFINNPWDIVRLKRIINEPKRGIGEATVKSIENISEGLNISPLEVIKNAAKYPMISKKASVLVPFAEMIQKLMAYSEEYTLDDFYDELLDVTGYSLHLVSQGEEGKSRLENINELKSNIIKYMQENENAELSGFLEEIALYTDLDSLNTDSDCVVLMTVHSAKGLEFPNVFLAGMEDGIFPSRLSMGSIDDMQEERRLAYVAITRAKEKLYITNASQRVLFGQTIRNAPSIFLSELPGEVCERTDLTGFGGSDSYYSKGTVSKKYGSSAPRAKTYSAHMVKKPKSAAVIDYTVGDYVSHAVFGKGEVLKATPMANDIMVEIKFEKAGVKKLMANFAKLSKI